MNPKQFYGPKKASESPLTDRINRSWDAQAAQRKKRPAAGRALRLQSNSLLTLLGPTVAWRHFPRQSEALEYCARAGSTVHVFAFECPSLGEGKRRYFATSYDHFWQSYKELNWDEKHHYELITEDTPVKLYFDLEFSKEQNAERNGGEMVDFLLEELARTFQELYSKPLPSQDMVQLDASTATKFSQHLIFPSVVFQTVLHAGMFVSFLCQTLLHRKPSEKLLVTNSGGSLALFIDQGVYTKNRNFRLFQSTKLGKTNPLLLTTECPVQEKTDRELFFLSLICNVGRLNEDQILTFDCEKYPLTNNRFGKLIRSVHPNNPVSTSQSGSSESPFPELDGFFERIITAGGLHGRIRQWQYFPDTQTVSYAISGDYKYCERIGRHHRSNNVLFVACLPKGTYHQKCMDPDCRMVNFTSQDYLLPFKLVTAPPVETEIEPVFCVDDFHDTAGDQLLTRVTLDF